MNLNQYSSEVQDHLKRKVEELEMTELNPIEKPVYGVYTITQLQAYNVSLSTSKISINKLKHFVKAELKAKYVSVVFFETISTLKGRKDIAIFYRALMKN